MLLLLAFLERPAILVLSETLALAAV